MLSRRSILRTAAAAFPGLLLPLRWARGAASTTPPENPSASWGAGPSNASGWFTNIAAKSGFAYRTNNDYTGRKFFPQPMCGGVAVLEYNNDGLLDLIITNYTVWTPQTDIHCNAEPGAR